MNPTHIIHFSGPVDLRPLPQGMRIRRFDVKDASAVHALLVDEHGEAVVGDLTEWTRLLLGDPDFDDRVSLIGDTDAGELVGVVLAGSDSRLRCFGVKADWRRKGAAHALMGRVLELYRRQSKTSVDAALDSALGGSKLLAARELLATFGFREVARA